MALDWFRPGSMRTMLESAIAEAIRRVKLEAKNDDTFVPAVDSASLVLASRHFVLPPAPNVTPVDEASLVLASRSFSALMSAVSGVSGRTLTFGTHLTGTSFNGTADVTLGVDAVSTNTASKMVTRDANGDFAMRDLTLRAVIASGNVAGLTLTGTLSTAAQPNITSHGILTILKLDTGVKLQLFTGGAADACGTAGMAAGTVSVATTAVTAKTKVIYSRRAPGGTLGHVSCVPAAGVGFVLNSTSATEASTFDWELVDAYP